MLAAGRAARPRMVFPRISGFSKLGQLFLQFSTALT
jgi:hypothetical protein